jgi:RNA polymerase sigma-70 factor, ECF subfamily
LEISVRHWRRVVCESINRSPSCEAALDCRLVGDRSTNSKARPHPPGFSESLLVKRVILRSLLRLRAQVQIVSIRDKMLGFGRAMDLSTLSHERLLKICAESGQVQAWEEFIARFNPLISAVALRTANKWAPTAEISLDDLVQDVYLRLCENNCRILRDFRPEYADSIFGFLKTVTSNLVHDRLRSRYATKRGSGEKHELLLATSLSANELPAKANCDVETIERDVLLREIDDHLTKVVSSEESDRNRTVFWLYYRSGLTARAISSIPGIDLSTKGVESLVFRLTGLIREFLLQKSSKTRVPNTPFLKEQKGHSVKDSF